MTVAQDVSRMGELPWPFLSAQRMCFGFFFVSFFVAPFGLNSSDSYSEVEILKPRFVQ